MLCLVGKVIGVFFVCTRACSLHSTRGPAVLGGLSTCVCLCNCNCMCSVHGFSCCCMDGRTRSPRIWYVCGRSLAFAQSGRFLTSRGCSRERFSLLVQALRFGGLSGHLPCTCTGSANSGCWAARANGLHRVRAGLRAYCWGVACALVAWRSGFVDRLCAAVVPQNSQLPPLSGRQIKWGYAFFSGWGSSRPVALFRLCASTVLVRIIEVRAWVCSARV